MPFYSRNIFPLLAAAAVLAAQTPGTAPLTATFQDSASYRWLNKKVLDSRLLDDMSTLDLVDIHKQSAARCRLARHRSNNPVPSGGR